jgi:alpha-tubulin suppressor-like RCC1 family protein
LGNNDVSIKSTPVIVTALEGAETLTRLTSITSSQYTTCGIRAGTGRTHVVCWGNNGLGGLGIGNANISIYRRALEVPGLSDYAKITGAAVGSMMCAIDSSGTPKCFGDNTYNRTGDNALGVRSPTGFNP